MSAAILNRTVETPATISRPHLAPSTPSKAKQWMTVCSIDQIVPYSGVTALIQDQQVAIFRLPGDEGDQVYAISNYDPFSKAFVLSRGIVGDRGGEYKIASPIYKHTFSLITGQCFDDPSIKLSTWAARIVDGHVQVQPRQS
jgi:nitrite reductase (NADH) small subunit